MKFSQLFGEKKDKSCFKNSKMKTLANLKGNEVFQVLKEFCNITLTVEIVSWLKDLTLVAKVALKTET